MVKLIPIKQNLIKVAAFCAVKGLVPATSGNFSARLESEQILITVSGKEKGALSESDFLIVNAEGESQDSSLKPSAETLLHLQIYRIFPEANFIAHFHSSSSAVLSKILMNKGINSLKIEGFELLKALSGVTTHDYSEVLPIFENSQNIAELAKYTEPVIKEFVASGKLLHGYLLAGHGLYTWAKTADEAIRHVDALNTLIESHLLEVTLSRY